jgi:signal transduction histidine kinase
VFFTVFIVAVPLAAGCLVRGRARMIQRLEQQGRELQEQEAAYIDAALRRERLRVASEFHHELTAGMQDLVETAGTLEASTAAADVAVLENQARQLLAETRQAVVALAAMPDETSSTTPPVDIPEPSDTGVETGQPWVALSAAALAVGLFVETQGSRLHPSSAATVAATCLLLALPLMFAWARPLVAVAVLWVVVAVFEHAVAPLAHTTSAVGLAFVPPFLVAALEPRRRAVTGLVVCWLGLLATSGFGPLPAYAALATVCWLAGTGLRQRSALVAELHLNNARLEQGRGALATQAVDEERMRIARELHDAVGHSLTVVALQAGAARRVWDTDRAKARSMLHTVRVVADAGLQELRSGPTAVSDGQAESLQDLLARARSAGLVLDDSIDDSVTELPPPQLATVYRVVQEAITNVLKHSPGATVAVSVHQVDDDVLVTVTNSAPTTAPVPGQGVGQGLAGMRGRVERAGGRVSHASTAGGGFVVQARLPLPVVSA